MEHGDAVPLRLMGNDESTPKPDPAIAPDDSHGDRDHPAAFCGDAHRACQSAGGHPDGTVYGRSGGSAGGDRKMGTGQALAHAIYHLLEESSPGRPGHILQDEKPGCPGSANLPARHPRAGDLFLHFCDPFWPAARHHCRDQHRHICRSGDAGHFPAGRLDAALLVRAAGLICLLLQTGLGAWSRPAELTDRSSSARDRDAGLRLARGRQHASLLGCAQSPCPAFDHPGLVYAGADLAHHPLINAGSTLPGLYPHCARQGCR